jgi:hypothetical protein
MGGAMLGLLGAHELTGCESNAKVIAYCKAFECVFPTTQISSADSSALDAVRKIIPYAETFLTLMEETRQWALGGPWVKFFHSASLALAAAPETGSCSEAAFIRISQRLFQSASKVPPSRLDPDCIGRDTEQLLIEAKDASNDQKFAHADLILVAGMKRLGCNGKHLYCDPNQSALMLKLAMARVETFLAEYQDNLESRRWQPDCASDASETSDNLITTKMLCDGLREAMVNSRAPRELKAPLSELLSNQLLVNWLNTITPND